MRTVRFTLTLCTVVFGLASIHTAQPSVAQDTRTMTVLGSIDGTAGGTERAWLTISGKVNGRTMSSAAWRPHSMPDAMGGALAGMSDERRAQMEERMEMMSEVMGDGAENPFAQMLGGDGAKQVKLRIMGVDPEAERILRQGGLTIDLPPFSAENVDKMLNGKNKAEISYHKNFSEDAGLYASSHGVGTAATVVFDRLEIVEGGGFAAGTFEGSLCPIRAMMGGDPDPEVCILVAGQFETELGEEEADIPASSSTN